MRPRSGGIIGGDEGEEVSEIGDVQEDFGGKGRAVRASGGVHQNALPAAADSASGVRAAIHQDGERRLLKKGNRKRKKNS